MMSKINYHHYHPPSVKKPLNSHPLRCGHHKCMMFKLIKLIFRTFKRDTRIENPMVYLCNNDLV